MIRNESVLPPEPSADDARRAAQLVETYQPITQQLSKVIVGQDAVIEQLLIAILARGHCLLEGVPGLAKTLLVRCLAEAMELSFRRIQFTPDLMPADITGTDIIQQDPSDRAAAVGLREGTDLRPDDSGGRDQPHAAEDPGRAAGGDAGALGHRSAGETYKLEEPFFVLATQNPIEQEGTYPLPEAQRDRFLFHVVVDYPEYEQERQIIMQTTGTFDAELAPVIDGPHDPSLPADGATRAGARPCAGLRAALGPPCPAERSAGAPISSGN